MISVDNWWWGAVSYACCHLLHIAWWRIAPPHRALLPLLISFYGPLIVDAVWLTPSAALLHALLAANYIAVYPAVQASSPTLRMVLLLRSGLTEPQLLTALSTDRLLDDRLSDLQKSGLLVTHEGKLVLSRRGNWLASFFLAYRRLLGLPEGAG